jgi:hypothetical protein
MNILYLLYGLSVGGGAQLKTPSITVPMILGLFLLFRFTLEVKFFSFIFRDSLNNIFNNF